MRAVRSLVVAILVWVVLPSASVAQSLAVDEHRADQWGWAVDHETMVAGREAALRECGSACSGVLTFSRCVTYEADQDTNRTAVGWAEAHASAADAQQRALVECGARGSGSGCIPQVWACNGPVIDGGLNLDLARRREAPQVLQAMAVDPGGSDDPFVSLTRAAIRDWQWSVGGVSEGFLDDAATEALRSARETGPAGGGGCTGGCTDRAGCGRRDADVVAGGRLNREPIGYRSAGESILAAHPEQQQPCAIRGISSGVPGGVIQ